MLWHLIARVSREDSAFYPSGEMTNRFGNWKVPFNLDWSGYLFIPALFQKGFQVAELSGDHIINYHLSIKQGCSSDWHLVGSAAMGACQETHQGLPHCAPQEPGCAPLATTGWTRERNLSQGSPGPTRFKRDWMSRKWAQPVGVIQTCWRHCILFQEA